MAKKETKKKATTKKEEPTYEYIKVDVNSKSPLSRVMITERELQKNTDRYFINCEHAKQHAKNELIMIKDKFDWNDYNERMWQINNYV
jgi:hypothetical protein